MLPMFLFAALLAPGDGKIVAQDDWHSLSILEVGGAAPKSPVQYLRVAAGDLDGDGRADDALLKLHCSDGVVKSALIRPVGDAAGPAGSGHSERRQHKPMTIVKEWGPASPLLRAMKTGYDVKKVEGARMDSQGWKPASLSGSDGLCHAVAAAAATIVKSKSNITNN